MPSSNPPEVTRPLDLIEALSVFSACYAVGGLVLVSMLLDLPLSWWSAATAFSITWFVYLLHRDRMARRQREAPSIRSRLLRRHARLVSILLGISGVLSLGTSVMTSVWLPLLLPASVLGMLLYGKGLDGRRPRDMLVIKNACVGMSMALFWIILAIAPVVGEFEVTPTFWSVVVAVTLLVLSDAMYCDLGDVATDARTLSRTAPIQWGPDGTRLATDGCVVFVALLLVLSGPSGSSYPSIWFIVPLLLLLSQGVLRLVSMRRIRAAIDVRLLLLASSSAVLSMWFSSTT